MGKIEGYEPSGAPYVDGADRDPYIGRACVITDVMDDPKARYGPRWVVTVSMLDSGEMIALGLGKNAYRDRVLSGVQDAISEGEPIDPVVLYRDADHPGVNGQLPWAFRSATDAEILVILDRGEDDDPRGTIAEIVEKGRKGKA